MTGLYNSVTLVLIYHQSRTQLAVSNFAREHACNKKMLGTLPEMFTKNIPRKSPYPVLIFV